MKQAGPFLIAVYAHEDIDRVRPIVRALEQAGVPVWVELDDLSPGSNFDNAITDSIKRANGAIVFVSSHMRNSRYPQLELMALHAQGKPIYPVFLEEVGALPLSILHILEPLAPVDLANWADGGLRVFAQRIKDSWRDLRSAEAIPAGSQAEAYTREVATALAREARKQPAMTPKLAGPPTKVFIVHGHDESLLQEVEGHLALLGVESIVLRRIGGAAQSLFQKFMQWGSDTRFALVLLSADDLGVSRTQYEAEGIGERALQFRSRQNVILELGFFYGHLGWENVFVLFKKPEKVFPNFERPSDLEGVVFDMVDASGRWKSYLEGKLREAGFVLR